MRPSRPRSRPPGPRSSGRSSQGGVIPSSRRVARCGLDPLRRLRARVVEHVGRHRRRARGHRALLRRGHPLRAGRRRAARRRRADAAARCSTDFALSALVGLLPFATTYGLIYWAEQYVTSGPDRGPVRRAAALRRAAGGGRCCPPSRCARGWCSASGSRSSASSSPSARASTSAPASTPRWPRWR